MVGATVATRGGDGIEVADDGPVRLITIDRPERRNAIDSPAAAALRVAFEAFDSDDGASVAVLSGRGGHFCAGGASMGPRRSGSVWPTG